MPSVYAWIEDSVGTTVVENADISKDTASIAWSNAPLTSGDYTLKVKVQDFGDLESDVASFSFTKAAASFRYWRYADIVITGTNGVMVANWRLYSGSSQSGTAYPPTMTDATTPAPYVASSSFFYNATYADWKAFDGSIAGTFWWTLGHNAEATYNDWLQIDLGAIETIQSMSFTTGNQATYNASQFTIYASNTGAFAGEEVVIGTFYPSTTPQSTLNVG